jgi:hypothetical protein
LQASITGAGLVLAIYSLVLSRAQEILERRAEQRDQVRKTLAEKVNRDETGIEPLARDYEAKRALPAYLDWQIGATFCLYCASSLLTWYSLFFAAEWWAGWLAVWAFGLATALFLIFGVLIIGDITSVLQERSRELAKRRGKVKDFTG